MSKNQNLYEEKIPLSKEIRGADVALPGDEIVDNSDNQFTYGLGMNSKGVKLYSTVFGKPKRVNNLLVATPVFNFKYHANVGDVVIGRIVEIYNKKWKVFCNGKGESTLALGSILLPGTVQRRKNKEDEVEMRSFYKINDLIVCEVMKVNKSGSFSIHTRSEKYGKLGPGILVSVPSMLVKKNTSFIEGNGVKMVVGSNGFIWINTDNYDKLVCLRNKIKEMSRYKEVIDFETLLSKIKV